MARLDDADQDTFFKLYFYTDIRVAGFDAFSTILHNYNTVGVWSLHHEFEGNAQLRRDTRVQLCRIAVFDKSERSRFITETFQCFIENF